MKNLKKIFALVLVATLAFAFTGCGAKEEKKGEVKEPVKEEKKLEKIVIGVSPAPHQVIIENLKEDFKAAGLDVEVKAFTDYVMPNQALADGSLDANYFQHKPYLDKFKADHKLDLVSLGGVHVEPLGFYSTKYKSLDELPEGAEVLIPNDATNGARALILLEKNGLIKLKDNKDLNATEKDIVENNKKIKFTAVDAPVIAGAYIDVAGGVINSNFAIDAKIDPKTAVVKEDKDSPYTNIIAVKTADKDKAKFKKLMEVLHSDKNKKFIEEKYNGEILPAFTNN